VRITTDINGVGSYPVASFGISDTGLSRSVTTVFSDGEVHSILQKIPPPPKHFIRTSKRSVKTFTTYLIGN
jgi:hypothetical protein